MWTKYGAWSATQNKNEFTGSQSISLCRLQICDVMTPVLKWKPDNIMNLNIVRVYSNIFYDHKKGETMLSAYTVSHEHSQHIDDGSVL